MKRKVVLFGLGLLLCLPGGLLKAVDATASDDLPAEEYVPLIPPGPGLFGSHEFRSNLRALPQWSRVMSMAMNQVEDMTSCNPEKDNCSASALSWQKIIHEAQGMPTYERLKAVNTFFNRWPYRLDIDAFGVSEYWATPLEFLRMSGDCEDYSITKYYALKQLGVPIEKMRIVVVQDTIRNIPHAVLVVKAGQENYVLDNLSDLVLSHAKYTHYMPQYSINERFRWAHVAPNLMRQRP